MTEKPGGERLFRAWRDVEVPLDEEAGRARFLESTVARARAPGPRSSARVLVLAAAAILACAVALLVWRRPTPLRFATATGEGQLQAWLATDTKSEMPLSFSEGTRVVILPDSRGRVETLDPEGASFLLERGEVRARVVHRTRTDWRFRAGPFEVQVTGTALAVAWDPAAERFAVTVDEGSVVVRGPRLGVQQIVRAGERCLVDLPSGTMRMSGTLADAGTEPAAAKDASADTVEAPAASSAPERAAHVARAPAISWTTLEERGDYDGAYAAATSTGLASLYRASSSDELLRLAQVAQLSGHRATEREALLACRRRFPGTEQGAVAAYELGRASAPGEAATWFDAYLREQPSGPLAREALGRRVEALAAAGDDSAARDAATRYLARYPDGPHSRLARGVLAGNSEMKLGKGAHALGLAAVLVLVLVLVSPRASAQSGATLVAILTSEPSAPLTRRVRAGLEGLGVDVIVLKPPAEGTTQRAPLEDAARGVGAAAAIRLVVSSEGKVEVWVADRVTGKTVVRELDASGTNASDASVALGTVELLRASLMELHSGEPPHGDVPATPKLEALGLPAAAPAPAPPRLGLAVGGGTELGVGGLGPSIDLRLALWVRVAGRLGVRLAGDTTLVPSHVTNPDGAVDVRSQWLGAALAYDLADPASTWTPQLSLGVAAVHLTTTGTAQPPNVGVNADTWLAAPTAGAAISWAFVRGIRARADGLTAWALPAARVRTPSAEAGRWGAPALMLSLGIEMLWSP